MIVIAPIIITCPNDSHERTLIGICSPSCGSSVSYEPDPATLPDGISVSSGSYPCDNAWHNRPLAVTVDETAEGGSHSIQIRGTTSLGSMCSRQITVNVLKVDIDGDGNQDGQVDVEGGDDDLEDVLPGVITLCNLDDDDQDGNKDGLGPEAATVDDGGQTPDSDDMAPVVLRSIPTLPAGWGMRLTLHTATNVSLEPPVGPADVVRIFAPPPAGSLPGTSPAPILGPSPQSDTLTFVEDDAAHDADLTALRSGAVNLLVEGLEFAGEVMLTAEILDTQQNVACSDDVQLKVAPLLLLHHMNGAVTSYVSRVAELPPLDPVEVSAESTAYTLQRFPAETPAGVTDLVIDGTDPMGNGDDQWARDQFQFGVTPQPFAMSASGSGGSLPVVT